MKRAALASLLAAVLALPLSVSAQGPEAAGLSQPFAEIGEQIVLTLELVAEAGATVEVDAGAESWGDVRVIRVLSEEVVAVAGGERHRLELLTAPFAPGNLQFSPALLVTTPAEVSRVELPSLALTVPSALAPGEPLVLSPLPPMFGIGGAQSPFLWPAVIAGGLLAAVVLVAAVGFAIRVLRRLPRPAPMVEEEVPLEPGDALAAAAALLETDATGAYRAIGSAVRRVLGDRYAFPAQALTTEELQRRMEVAGVDGWEARLARELLRECDAVVYAGYRPATERREADLTVAREIVGSEA